MHSAWLLPSASCTASSTVSIQSFSKPSLFFLYLCIKYWCECKCPSWKEMKSDSVRINFVSSQSDLISVYLQDWVSYCVPVCYCVYIIVVNLSPPHLLTPHPAPAPSAENHLWAVMDSHEFTRLMTNLSGTAALWASVWQQASLWLTHMHTHAHRHRKYSCWCLYLTVGTRLFKHWSSWVCVRRTHSIRLCINLSDSVCVLGGWFFAVIVHWTVAPHDTQRCMCALRRPCFCVCSHVWASAAYPPRPRCPD